MFSLSLFDKHWKPNLTREEAWDLVNKCIAEVRERLVVAPAMYTVKFVDKDGVHTHEYNAEERNPLRKD